MLSIKLSNDLSDKLGAKTAEEAFSKIEDLINAKESKNQGDQDILNEINSIRTEIENLHALADRIALIEASQTEPKQPTEEEIAALVEKEAASQVTAAIAAAGIAPLPGQTDDTTDAAAPSWDEYESIQDAQAKRDYWSTNQKALLALNRR